MKSYLSLELKGDIYTYTASFKSCSTAQSEEHGNVNKGFLNLLQLTPLPLWELFLMAALLCPPS